MSQDELQATVVNIEEHVVSLRTKQLALYAWGLVIATFSVCGIYFGLKYGMDQMQQSFTYEMKSMRGDFKSDMKDMEVRINAKIDTISIRQITNRSDVMEQINNMKGGKQAQTSYYIERIINGHTTLIKVR